MKNGGMIIVDGERIMVKKYTKLEYEEPEDNHRMHTESEKASYNKNFDYDGWSKLVRREKNPLNGNAFLDK